MRAWGASLAVALIAVALGCHQPPKDADLPRVQQPDLPTRGPAGLPAGGPGVPGSEVKRPPETTTTIVSRPRP